MLLINILSKIFGTKQDKDMKLLRPLVAKANEAWEPIKKLSDEELQAKTVEFRDRLSNGETLDDMMFEAFSVVREATHRVLGDSKKFINSETGKEISFMAHFDVQVLAAVVLHNGNIAEMKTGEGKTQVGPMAAYLNALDGKGVHVITVNDYLARRDSEWMGLIFNFLGLTVGCLDNTQPGTAERRAAYNCDITYGTNNEFGFDYLRDNMAVTKDDCVMRELNFAIIDEVDNILIDEARTPLIISGAANKDNKEYEELRPQINRLIMAQKELITQLLKDLKPFLDGEQEYDFNFGRLMLILKRGAPKSQKLLDALKITAIAKQMKAVEAEYLREKKLNELNEELFYSIDESGHSAEMTEKGRIYVSGENSDFFVIPDLSIQIGTINDNKELSVEDKNLAREEVHRAYAARTERIHCVAQLLRAFALFEKDVGYVVKDGQVQIVDEFTGRILDGRRYSDGLHQALEAKEQVKVAGESQTLATITFQNFFKMYNKVSGMTGTAVTEAKEFGDIYELDVIQVPTNQPIARKDYDDEIYKTQREKFNAVVQEIKRVSALGSPILVGTVSIEKSEYIGQLLQKEGVKHEVLNAKNHTREASIVAQAGRKSAVTIATNMAGRGTDIKLGGNFEALAHDKLIMDGEDPEQFTPEEMVARYPKLNDEIKAEHDEVLEAGGLVVIGTERHESRRIDNQLRGRSGRQGDSGASQFYLSLDDDLMRVFGSDRIAGLMDKMGAEEGEVISHPLVSKAIGNAQRRVEGRNYEIRKHLKDYDDVMNHQRTQIYGLRHRILNGNDVKSEILDQFAGALEEVVLTNCDGVNDSWNLDDLKVQLASIFGITIDENIDLLSITQGELYDTLWESIIEFYSTKENRIGEEQIRDLERSAFLMTIDDLWKNHLYEMDHLKDGVQYRSFGQKNPLYEYQREGLQLFEQFRSLIAQRISTVLFQFEIVERPSQTVNAVESHQATGQFGRSASSEQQAQKPQAGRQQGPRRAPQKQETLVRSMPKVGRNDPCPCGSGKKFKKCHGAA
jgi:preprotein translocase subunit SecA